MNSVFNPEVLQLCRLTVSTAASVRNELVGIEPVRDTWLWRVWQAILLAKRPLYTHEIRKLSGMQGRNTAACISALIRRGFVEPLGTEFPKQYRARAGGA